MVLFFEWYRTAVDQKSSSGLPMTGEDTGLGALASPLAGYLGKVQERAASLEHCPWCTSKGLTYPLRSYRINLQQSIPLCTNLLCYFPLVSKPLEDVCAKLDPVKPGNKRKNPLPLGKEESIEHSPKRLQSSEFDSLGTQRVTDTHTSQAGHCAVDAVSNGQRAAPKTDAEKANGYRSDSDCPVAEATGWESLRDEAVALQKEPDSAACAEGFAPPAGSASAGHLQSSPEALLTTHWDEPALSPHCGALGTSEAADDLGQVKSHPEVLSRRRGLPSNEPSFTNEDIDSTEIDAPLPQLKEQAARTEQKSPTADVTTCKDVAGVKPEAEDLSPTSLTQPETLVSVPNPLFWRNDDNLCWLDSLLVALVNCKSLRKSKPREEPQRSSVWQLMHEYEDICASVQVHQQTGRDGVAMVPNHVLQKANADLQRLRVSVFKLLQPKLHCKLGQKETPVFAMPLLLTMDSWAEPLFQTTFRWEFKCSRCTAASEERFMKTLPTFTHIVPDWHPLGAVHFAPCNMCCRKRQKRTMTLESVPPVFALHFVDGLPHINVGAYAFSFTGKHYSVTTVIQYNQRLKHFVTWTCNAAGSWQEYDDLKHPDCETHQTLPFPAREMHVVFWEAQEEKGPRVCSPSSTLFDSPASKSEVNSGPSAGDLAAGEPLTCSPDQSQHDDTDIVCALSVSKDHSVLMDTTVAGGVDASIGSTTLLDAFEGLSRDDIITLTLEPLEPDSETQPVSDAARTQVSSGPSGYEVLGVTPDSSSAALAGDSCRGPDAKPLATSSVSEAESADGSSSDPTFVPGARRRPTGGRGNARGKTVGRQTGKKAGSSKAATPVSPPVSSRVVANEPSGPAPQENAPPVETRKQSRAPSSPDTSPPSANQKSSTVPLPPLDPKAQWSFLLSRHPAHKTIAKSAPAPAPSPVARAGPTPPAHSTPIPARRLQVPGGLLPKPPLRTEEGDGLPPKAAEMYGAFGAKSSNAPSPLPSHTPLNVASKPFNPITSHHQTPRVKTTVASALPPTLQAKGLPKIISSKKQSGHVSEIPPPLMDPATLRLKLMKKLKAKKKKLAKLNQQLGHPGGAGLRPDSTDLTSPNTVTSSTYDGSTSSDFFSDLLSPATTASNLSPDSTDVLEMLAGRQDGVEQFDYGVSAALGASQMNGVSTENFLDEFISQAAAERPTEAESEVLSALEELLM